MSQAASWRPQQQRERSSDSIHEPYHASTDHADPRQSLEVMPRRQASETKSEEWEHGRSRGHSKVPYSDPQGTRNEPSD